MQTSSKTKDDITINIHTIYTHSHAHIYIYNPTHYYYNQSEAFSLIYRLDKNILFMMVTNINFGVFRLLILRKILIQN